MFVGLMCWFAANVTRRPCFARLTASAMWPSPIRSLVAKSATPSAVVSRSPPSTLSAKGARAGSLMRGRSRRTGAGTALTFEAFDGECNVMSAEAEAVAQHGADFTRHGDVRRVVEIELGIRRLIIDRRRNDAVACGERAEDELHCAARPEHVAGHGLGGAHIH